MVHNTFQLSIVIPVYRGEATIAPLVDELFDKLGKVLAQVVLVNDASPDQSDAVCQDLFRKYAPQLIYLRLARNFGEHNAVMAGLSKCTGDYAVIMDDDFQNPPEEVGKLLDHAIANRLDVVYSYYEVKQHSFWRNLGSSFHNDLATLLLKKPHDIYMSSFKCINRWMIDEILKYRGPYPYVDALIFRSTSSIGKVLVRHDSRANGKSGYTLKKLISLWLRVFVNYSILPLRFSTILGFAMSGLGALLGLIVVIERLIAPTGLPVGWASLVIVVLIFSGVQLVMLGLAGEYIGRMYLTINNTPQYAIREEYS